MKRIMFIIALIAALVASAISALAYPDYPYYNYNYYDQDDNTPIISGPYPRYYLFYKDFGDEKDFKFDDFNHFDDFRGYSDLDVIYADGTIDVMRNPYPRDLDMTGVDTSQKMFGKHVYGTLPGGAMYRKHYMHDHDWEMDYDYGYDYGYFEPVSYYRSKPVYGCRSRISCNI